MFANITRQTSFLVRLHPGSTGKDPFPGGDIRKNYVAEAYTRKPIYPLACKGEMHVY